MQIFPRLRQSNYLFFFGLCLLVAGLPVSLFLTSLSQFFIAGSFFLEGDLSTKIKRYISNRSALLLTGIWLLHVAGLLWTTDIQEGLKDIRIKLPLLILPLVMSGSAPLSTKQFRFILYLFVFSVFSGSLVSIAVLNGLIPTKAPIYDIREIFILGVSHIRFALFTCLAVIVVGWLMYTREQKTFGSKLLLSALMLWLSIFLFIIESITGISILIICGLLFLWYNVIRHQSKWLRFASAVLVIAIPLSLFFYLKNFVQTYSPAPPQELDFTKKTNRGNAYFFDTTNTQVENGYRVYAYVCEYEMREEWNKRSSIPFDSLDQRKQPVKSTLIRFLASKGETKDGDAVLRLSDEEVHSIERGIANVYYEHISSIKSRLLQILWEYHEYMRGGDPSGHSVTQRLEFWRAAAAIIADHPWTGVGTGDMPEAYGEEYQKMNTQLMQKYRLRAHNQYLAIAVAFGIPALIYFLFTLFYPIRKALRNQNILFISFWVIAFFSMFTEDTLETQAGATFVALFWSLFLFSSDAAEIEDVKNQF
ncbi:MAG TPA: O-antigen ligase family protein [Bacteroidia bacterium]|nr:O-antigen ligase family protein [Bacteroidia bacterium]